MPITVGTVGKVSPKRFEAFATAGQTDIVIPDNVSAEAIVFINGKPLFLGAYTIVLKTITLNTALTISDEILVINYI